MKKFSDPVIMAIFAGFLFCTIIATAAYRDITETEYYLRTGIDTCTNEKVYVVMRNRIWEKDWAYYITDNLADAQELLCKKLKDIKFNET